MPLAKKQIFLAGATGMAGASILKYFLEHYPQVKIRAAYFNTQPFIKDSRIEYVRTDLRNYEQCRESVKGCDAAIMAAAHSAGAEFILSKPWEHIKENLFMNIQLLDALSASSVKRIIYISSATLYQDFEGSIKEEELDLNKEPAKAYQGFGHAVRFIEKMAKFLHERFDKEVIIARAANIFGPYAKFDPRNSNFIPAIIRKAVDKMDPFEVWGSPEVTRDVIYADDFAKVIVTLLEEEKIKFDIFNVGTGVQTTVGMVVKWALECAGHKPSAINYAQGKPTTIKFRALDCVKIRNVIGWLPQYTAQDGIRLTTQWWVENKGWWKK